MTSKKKATSELAELRQNFQAGLLSKANFIKQCYVHHTQLFNYPEFMRNTDIASIEITDQGVCMTTRELGIKMMANHSDQRIAPVEILNFEETEKNEIKVLKKLVKKNYGDKFIMIDVGANIGWYSMNFAKSFPKAHIYSFEPIPKTHLSLLANVKINGLKNITTIQAGVSEHGGVATFYYDQELSANASLANLAEKENIEKLKVRIVTLDKFCRQKSIKPKLLKVDVEGAELFVFKGAKQIISDNHPIIFAEMLRKWSSKFNYHPNQIIEFLKDLGYTCFSLRKDQLVPFVTMTDSTQETNFIFLNKERHYV
jgi:FkbM family methyltransferase